MTELQDWRTMEAEERPQAKRLAEYFKTRPWEPDDPMRGRILPAPRILDVGCGPGLYVEEMRALGMEAYGVDNDPRLVESEWLRRIDILCSPSKQMASKLFDACDVVLSIEVGEHIPQDGAVQYIQFIDLTGCDVVYFSAARPGQGGIGHINLRPKSYWCERFHHAGFWLDPDATEAWLSWMRQGPHMGWLAHPQYGNGMVFRRA